MFKYSRRFANIGFTDELVSMESSRVKSDIIKAIALLTRYFDVKYDTYLHDHFLAWRKRKELRWNYPITTNTYKLAKLLTVAEVTKSIKKLPIRYKIFAIFALTTGLRPTEAFRAFNNHSKLCHNGLMELFWDRGTKKANAVFCHPTLHNRILFTMSGSAYNYINKRSIGFELRHLRKVNYTVNATQLDALLAEFMQGRRGNVSQRHYYLPAMTEHKRKWLKVWTPIVNTSIQ
ncbi:MAG: integrase [Nitrosarchaeum sp.]